MTHAARLTEDQQRTVTTARKLAGLDAGEIRAAAGEDDPGMACAVAFGRAQAAIGFLLAIIDDLTGTGQ